MTRYVVVRNGLYFQEVLGTAGYWTKHKQYATFYTDYGTAQWVAVSRDAEVEVF